MQDNQTDQNRLTMGKKSYTLLELQQRIRETIETTFDDTYWIVAEISEMKINPRGHCYLELIEKRGDREQPVARARANIWAPVFRILRPYFETTTGRRLTAGIKVMFNVEVTFHEIYGLSLNVRDIDPAYTLGEMALRRQEIIARLRKEGILEMNRQLPFPLVPQRIAVISSATAAGYQDFIDQLTGAGYHFHYELFPAMMQGEETSATVIAALEAVYAREEEFDVVVLIRGGGSQADLASFDDYALAQHIAQFPLPVLTGIGHEKDETVADIVAYTALKTPTAVAEFLLDRVIDYHRRLSLLARRIALLTRETVAARHRQLEAAAWRIRETVSHHLSRARQHHRQMLHLLAYHSKNDLAAQREQLHHLSHLIGHNALRFLTRQERTITRIRPVLAGYTRHHMEKLHHHHLLLNERLHHLDPQTILKRGYSITRLHGKALTDASQVQPGDLLVTRLHKGKVTSKVTDKQMQR